MATTHDRLTEVEELDALYRASPDLERSRSLPVQDWSHRILWAWVAVLGSIVLFEPAPTNPNAPVPAWANALLFGFTVAMFAAMIGLSLRRQWGLRASLVAGGIGAVVGIACILTDHHPGVWAGYEIAAFSGLTVASAVAPRRVR